MDFTTWLQQWLARHPLKMRDLNAEDRARFTQTVMQRMPAPASAATPGWRALLASLLRPQLALGMAAAAILAVLLVGRQAPGPAAVAQAGPSVEERALIVAALNDPTSDVLAAVDEQALADELMAQDALMLAEATPTADEQWLNQTLELLQQFDEDVSSDGAEASDEEWLQDLQLLDDAELSTRS